MEKLCIAVLVKNKEYCRDLIRRLGEIMPGVEFLIPGSGQLADAADFALDDETAGAFFPVSRLAARIAEAAGERFSSYLQDGESNMRTYVVRSSCGGTGCTAVGITIARILAGRSGSRIAFVSIGDGRDAAMYAETGPCVFRGRELYYMLSHGMNADIERYVCEDRYGVTVLAAEKYTGELTEYLKKNGFSAVIADAGRVPEGRYIPAHAAVNIEASGDKRSEDFEQRAGEETVWGSSEFYVLNKAAYRIADRHLVKVPLDSGSFVRSGEKIEISMDKSFAAAVRELVTIIERELDDEQSDFYK